MNHDRLAAELVRSAQGQFQRAVFGDVIGGDAEIFADLSEDCAVGVEDDAGARRGPWVASCSAVGEEAARRHLHARLWQAAATAVVEVCGFGGP